MPRLRLKLEYTVHRTTYRTWNHQLDNDYVLTMEEAEQYVAKVRSSERGTYVYYNPESPSQSFTKRDISPSHILAIAIGLGITAVAYLNMVGKIVGK